MPIEYYAYLLMGAAAGGLISGLAGFGTSLFALGFWLQILEPLQAVSIVMIMSVVSGLQGVWLVRHSVLSQPKRLARFLLPALLGIPIGIATLTMIEPKVLKLTIAGFMLLYGGFFLLRRARPLLDRPTPIADAVVGFLGGVLGGAASLSGALPTMWCALRPWSKSETRAVLQPFNVVVLGLTMAILAFKGVYTWQSLKLIAIALPVTLLFAQIGITIFKRLSDDQFRRLLISMMFISGLVLTVRELLW
jgi:uncharacterized membrane protein YfcA